VTGGAGELRLIPIPGLPEIRPGDDLASLIVEATRAGGPSLQSGDVLVVAQKVVSKAEGRLVDLSTITPSPFAEQLGQQWARDPRHFEVVLRESQRIVRMDRGVLISETRHGFVCANAGVDHSNVPGDDVVCLLPVDPDASAAALRDRIQELAGATLAVIVADTFGRPWREGATNIAIGVAGLAPLLDYRGQRDAHGYQLQVTQIAVADELASAAELVMRKVDQVPAAIVRGYAHQPDPGGARRLVRDPRADMFR
jgi:coenzyme F420-0:L-glutamate ligase/coenzyme F420-1:gamma-L-glutamate ligase